MPDFGAVVKLNKIPILGLVPESGTGAPSTPALGQLWNDTTGGVGTLTVWDGTAWRPYTYNAALSLTDGMLAGGISNGKLATDPLVRGNHSGQQFASTISDFDAQVRLSRLDQLAAPTAAVALNGQKITGLGLGTLPSDAVIKSQMDTAIANARAGIAGIKDPVRVASQVNVNLAAPGATVDGVAMAVGNRFLAPAQTTTSQRGLYVWNGAAVAATRSADADEIGEVTDGTMVAVAEGTDQNKQYMQTTADPGTVPGSWTQAWQVFTTGSTTYTAGVGITLTGSVFSLTAPVTVALGGTGATTVVAARAALGVPGKFAANAPALTPGVYAAVTHGLGTDDLVSMSARRLVAGTGTVGDYIDLDWRRGADNNNVLIKADVAFAAGDLRLVVAG